MAKRKYAMTEAKIARFLKEGRGKGRLDLYRPWLTIQDVPSIGLRSRIMGATTGREHHLMSERERSAFLDCDWCVDITDVREQFPLDRAETIAIAEGMGVKHPSDGGVDVVMTTDIVVNLVAHKDTEMIAFCIKSRSDLEDDRTIEKIEIERRYWVGHGVLFYLVTESEISTTRADNLRHFAERREFQNLYEPRSGYWIEVGEAIMAALPGSGEAPLVDVLAALERDLGYGTGDALAVFGHLVANRRLTLDLNVAFDSGMAASRIGVPSLTVGMSAS